MDITGNNFLSRDNNGDREQNFSVPGPEADIAKCLPFLCPNH